MIMGWGSFTKKIKKTAKTVSKPVRKITPAPKKIVRAVSKPVVRITRAAPKVIKVIDPIKNATTNAPKYLKDSGVAFYKAGQKSADHVQELGNGIKNTVSDVADVASEVIKTPFKIGNDLLESGKNMMDTGKKVILGVIIGGVVLVGAVVYKRAS